MADEKEKAERYQQVRDFALDYSLHHPDKNKDPFNSIEPQNITDAGNIIEHNKEGKELNVAYDKPITHEKMRLLKEGFKTGQIDLDPDKLKAQGKIIESAVGVVEYARGKHIDTGQLLKHASVSTYMQPALDVANGKVVAKEQERTELPEGVTMGHSKHAIKPGDHVKKDGHDAAGKIAVKP